MTGTARTGATRRGKSAREGVMATSSDAIMASESFFYGNDDNDDYDDILMVLILNMNDDL